MLVLRKGRQVCAFKLLLSKRERYDAQDLTQRFQERSPQGSEVAVVIDTKGQILDFTKAEKRAQIRVQVKEGAKQRHMACYCCWKKLPGGHSGYTSVGSREMVQLVKTLDAQV